MAKKKVSRARTSARRPFAARRSPPSRSKETVRVKTFIVEKPVYVPVRGGVEKTRREIIEREMEDAESYEPEQSRYLKKRRDPFFKKYAPRKEDEYPEEELPEDEKEAYSDEKESVPQAEGEEGEVFAEEDLPEEEQALDDAEAEIGVDGQVSQGQHSHYRSRGLFNNVWWKKGILWGFLFWIIIVAFAYVLEAFKMVSEVTSRENWFFLLIIFVAVSCVYQRFYNKSEPTPAQ